MRKNTYKIQHGFSLIETLIAVSILMIAITGPLSLVQAGLFSSNHQRNQVTAIYLAQEALEYIKNLRDTNTYKKVPWLTGPDGLHFLTDSNFYCGSGCYVDPHGNLTGGTFVQPENNSYLKRSDVGEVFIYSYAGTDTIYKRTVNMTSINADEVRVSVRIDWKDNALSRSYTVNEIIYNYEQ